VLRDSGLLDMATARTLLDQHQAGERDHSAALWSLSVFEAFLRQVHGSAVGEDIQAETVANVV
jgi:asparagine synthase (glutamine-hydrolysing)